MDEDEGAFLRRHAAFLRRLAKLDTRDDWLRAEYLALKREAEDEHAKRVWKAMPHAIQRESDPAYDEPMTKAQREAGLRRMTAGERKAALRHMQAALVQTAIANGDERPDAVARVARVTFDSKANVREALRQIGLGIKRSGV